MKRRLRHDPAAPGNNERQMASTNNPRAEKMATEVKVRVKSVECPHCGKDVEGWVGDPRGTSEECDSCGGQFMVAQGASIVID